jgi:hypothetical protein
MCISKTKWGGIRICSMGVFAWPKKEKEAQHEHVGHG